MIEFEVAKNLQPGMELFVMEDTTQLEKYSTLQVLKIDSVDTEYEEVDIEVKIISGKYKGYKQRIFNTQRGLILNNDTAKNKYFENRFENINNRIRELNSERLKIYKERNKSLEIKNLDEYKAGLILNAFDTLTDKESTKEHKLSYLKDNLPELIKSIA